MAGEPANEGAGPRPTLSAAPPIDWYVACASGELGERPLARSLRGVPIVLFRGERGDPAALLDRCAHRNVPLSLGRMRGPHLECAYHGWRYDERGGCVAVPGLCGAHDAKGRVPRFAALESDGFVWVYAAPDVEPAKQPFRLPAGGAGYTSVRRTVEIDAGLHATIENALDVPHTAFLHGGLFRGGRAPREITVVITRSADRVEAEYVGERRPEGLAGRLLSPSGGVVTHFDRFILPSVAQVEYRMGEENHLVITSICTPVDDLRTRLYAVAQFRLRVPGWMARPILTPIALRILRQDVEILRRQTETVRRFGGEDFISTELDIMGTQISKLMRRAAAGQPLDSGESFRREIRIRI